MAFLTFSNVMTSQNIKISELKTTKENRIEVIIESDTPFYIGAQDYFLYIGDEYLKNPKHITEEDNTHYLIYTIDNKTFRKLPNAGATYLSYGKIEYPTTIFKGKDVKGITKLNNFEKSILSNN